MSLKSINFLVLTVLFGFVSVQAGFPRTMHYKKPDKTVWPIIDLSKENFSSPQEAKKMLASLSQERIQDIVIINDIDEDLWRGRDNIFIKDENVFFMTMTLNLITALFDDQVIICTKSIFKNFKYLADVWNDLVIFELQKFKQKYNKSILNVADSELQELHRISKRLTEISFQVDKYFQFGQRKTDFPEAQDILKNLSVQEKAFWDLFFCSKADDILRQKNSYLVYEVNDDYLLFLPNLKEGQLSSLSNVFSKIYLGLDLSSLYFIRNLEIDPVIVNYQIDEQFDLGLKLQDALKKIFVNKQEFKKNENYSSKYLLPRFNIFINGHGSETDSFLGMNKSNIQPLLLLLNNHLWMKTLIMSSCYPGGKRFQEIFGNSLKDLSNFSEKLNYTIMTVGSFFATTYSFLDYTGWFNYYDFLTKHFFKSLFNYISLDKNEFLEALNFIKNEAYYEFSNYGSIKFPNTGWIMASDYGKEVVNITETKVLSLENQETLPISNDKKIVLLNYSNIPLTLKLEQNIDYLQLDKICKILPINYLYSIFFIQKLEISLLKQNNQSHLKNIFIAYFLSKIFNVFDLDIEEQKFILIDEILVHEKDQEKKILCITIDYLNKTIRFFSEEKDKSGEIKLYDNSYDIVTGIFIPKLADNVDSLSYLLMYNLLKKSLEMNSNFSDKLNFVKKLESLPKSLDLAPTIIQESHTRKEIEDKIKEAILNKELNPAALPFTSKSNSLKSKAHLNSPKRKVHNPYQMKKTENEKVDKKENKVSVLSTFDPRENPYAKGLTN